MIGATGVQDSQENVERLRKAGGRPRMLLNAVPSWSLFTRAWTLLKFLDWKLLIRKTVLHGGHLKNREKY